MEVEALLSTSTICRRHAALQESLTSVTYLRDIVQECKSFGLDIEASAKYEEANVLWDYGEQEKSIRIRQDLVDYGNFDSQDRQISLPVLMAKLVSLRRWMRGDSADRPRAIILQKLALQRLIKLSKSSYSLLFTS